MTQYDNAHTGRWTNEQHEKFLLGIQLYGKNWKKIEHMIPLRSCSQIRSHAQKYFLKLKKDSKLKSSPNQEESEPSQSSVHNQNSTGSVKSQENNDYSYFMNKIVQFTRSHERLDIWEAMIDSGSSKENVANGSSLAVSQDQKPHQSLQKTALTHFQKFMNAV